LAISSQEARSSVGNELSVLLAKEQDSSMHHLLRGNKLEEKKWIWKLPYELRIALRNARIVYLRTIQKLTSKMFKTYLIYDCARCEDCGRNVHDFSVPDELWIKVYGSDGGILCFDCFCDRADRKFHFKWRMKWTKEGWDWYKVSN